MHKFSNAVPPSSALMALRFLALLDVRHESAPTEHLVLSNGALRYKNLCIIRADFPVSE